jgi:pimeloyl-ACP methyl ester carboxylesterase
VDDTLRTLDAIGRESIVVGWSLGGLLAQKVAEAGRCRAAVLVAPVAPRDVRTFPRLGALPTYLRHLPDMLLGRPFLPSYGSAVRTLLNRVPETDRRRLYDMMVPDSGIVGRQIALTGVRVDASRVRCPMLCVVGLEDNIAPARAVRRIARKYGADLLEYPDHAHSLTEEPGWEAIARDVLAWLEAKVLAQAETAAARTG